MLRVEGIGFLGGSYPLIRWVQYPYPLPKTFEVEMKTVKFDTLKKKAKIQLEHMKFGFQRDSAFLAAVVATNNSEKAFNVLDGWYSAAEKLIDIWDVRMVAGLVRAFPAIAPKQFKSISCEMLDNENSDWVVTFN